jgi:hypothetical protein
MSDQEPINAEAVAESSLPATRPPDVEQAESASYQQTARGRIVALPLATGLITLGALLLLEPRVEGFDVTLPVAALIIIASLVLTNLFRFFASNRRERGLLFLALAALSLGGALAIINVGSLELHEWWPIALVGGAVALLITYLLEPQHDRGLLGLALLVLLSGIVSFTVTLDLIPPEMADTITDFWPLLLAFIGITLIPLALRRSANR